MENFKAFELSNSEFIFGGRLWATNGSNGKADVFNDETMVVHEIEGPLN